MTQENIRIVVNLTPVSVDCIDHLVAAGVYMNRQTVIRDAVRILLTSRRMSPFNLEAEG